MTMKCNHNQIRATNIELYVYFITIFEFWGVGVGVFFKRKIHDNIHNLVTNKY